MAEAMECSTSFSALQICSCNSNMSSSGGGGGVKIGGLWKRSQGIRRFSKHNYKHRVFILTDQALSYYGGTIDRVGQCKGRVQLDKVRAVEFVDITAFNLAHTMQIVYHTKKSGFTTLYIIATTKEECADWVSTLRQVCYFNRDMLMHYHPGALVKNKWTCCLQRGQTTLGCQPTYHLLTRSSSRYAQLRRKDTLTSSQRWARTGFHSNRANDSSSGHGGGTLGNPKSPADGVYSPRGQCLSNSCMDLCTRSPLRKEPPFSPAQQSTVNTSSLRSSRNSNDHSVGMGSLLLTRVSVTTTGTEVDGEERQSRHSGNLREESPRSPMVPRGKLGGRSQVAPAWTTSTTSNSSMPGGGPGSTPNRHSYEYEHRTLPRSFKARSTRRTEASTYCSSPVRSPGQLRRDCREEFEDIVPVAPPRVKKGNASSVCQSPPTTAVSPIMEYSYRAGPSVSSNASPLVSRSPLKHSKTFTAHSRRLPSSGGGFSQSMSALTRPLIEPKVSLSNPNIIHV